MIDARTGLSHDQVNAMAHDKRGYMWFGTSNGLSRFNGTHVKVYGTSSARCTLPSDHINALATDSEGLLYIGSESSYLTILDPLMDTLVNVPVPGAAGMDLTAVRISAIHVDKHDRIWISHGRRTLSLYDPQHRTFRTTMINTPNGHPHGRNWITEIVEGHGDIFWLCCEFGLVRFDPKDFSYVQYPNKPAAPTSYQYHVTSVLEEGPVLIVGTYNEGLWYFNKSTSTYARAGQFEDLVVTDIIAVDHDHTWLATLDKGVLELDMRSNRLASFDRDLAHTRSRDHSIFLSGATGFFQDPEGTRWVSTAQSGVALIAERNNRFELHALPVDPNYSDPSDVVRTAVDPITKHWLVLTLRQGLFELDSTGTVLGHVPSPWHSESPAMMHDLLVSPNGRISVSSSAGQYTVDRHNQRFRLERHEDRGAAFNGPAHRMWGDGQHGIWADITGRGLMHLDTVSGLVASIADRATGIATHLRYPLRDLLIDGQGRMWIAMTNAPPIVIWPDGHFAVWNSHADAIEDLPTDFLITLCEAQDGTVWAGTWMDGLIGMRIDANGTMHHEHITTSHQLPSNTIYGIVRAHDGSIWGTGKSGIFRFDPITHAVERFNMNDGMPSPEVYMSFDISPDGRRVFGGMYDGLLTFNVNLLKPEYHAPYVQIPLVQIPLVTVFDSTVALNADLLRVSPLRLPYDRSDLRFVLRSTNMVDPFNDTYAYRLSSPDTTWTIAPAQDAIIFSQIPPGDHSFEVKARTGSGPWGPISCVAFTILPPWWSTWWFRLLMLLVIIVLVYIGFRAYLFMRLRRQRSEHEREQAVMHERIRIAGDMHDELGSGLSVIKVKSEIALLTETRPDRMNELQEIARGSSELIDNMRQIVWTLGSGQEGLADLVAYMRNYSSRYLDQHGITCAFEVDDPSGSVLLSAIERRNLLLVVKEALHNVVKHAGATAVKISIVWSDGLHLTLSDNGRGFDPTSPNVHGMGMQSMRKRVEQLGGSFEVKNGAGTTLLIHIPHLGSTERSIAKPG